MYVSERKRSRAVRDDRYRGKMRKYRNTRESSCDSPSFCSDSSSIEGSGYTKSVATSVENLSSVMEAANSSETSSTEDSSASNISVRPIALAKAINNTRALLKKKSLVQVINNYIKAGIEEGIATPFLFLILLLVEGVVILFFFFFWCCGENRFRILIFYFYGAGWGFLSSIKKYSSKNHS